MKILPIIEYEEITIEKIQNLGINKEKAHKYFGELEEFAKNNDGRFLSFSRTGGIKSQNYVGLIQTKSGFIVEIYPKIAKHTQIEDAKEIVLKMLKSLRNHPFKNISQSTLDTKKLPFWEIFIRLFLTEVEGIIKKGLKKDYILRENNLKFLNLKLTQINFEESFQSLIQIFKGVTQLT